MLEGMSDEERNNREYIVARVEALAESLFVELVPFYRRERSSDWRREELIGDFETVEDYVAKQAISYAKAFVKAMDNEAEDILDAPVVIPPTPEK